MSCAAMREDLTALADASLEAQRAAAVREHVSGCAACGRELQEIEAAISATTALLAPLPELRPGFNTRMKAKLAEIDEAKARVPWRWWRPLVISAVSIAAVLVMASSVGGPQAVLVPLGLQAPPKRVAEKPQLFKDYQIIEHLEELENFETVIQTPLEEDITGKQQGSG